jgi:hypothetical protein
MGRSTLQQGRYQALAEIGEQSGGDFQYRGIILLRTQPSLSSLPVFRKDIEKTSGLGDLLPATAFIWDYF